MASYGHLYSQYLKAEDLSAGPLALTITAVKPEKVSRESDEKKLVVFFKEEDRGLVLNKTRYNACVEMFGTDDVDKWKGGTVKLFQTRTQFQGKIVPAIGVEAA